MRIGIICEGGPNGADKKVYTFLVQKLLSNVESDIEVACSPLGNKPALIEQCGMYTKALFEVNSCDRVIVIWDLQPPWKEKRQKACRKEDCELIKASLVAAQLSEQQLKRVHLICMEQELETLFLCDERAISTYLSQKSKRLCKVKRFRNPEHLVNPKDEVNKIFYAHAGRAHRYVDMKDAEGIIRLVEIGKLRCCASFLRFFQKVVGDQS